MKRIFLLVALLLSDETLGKGASGFGGRSSVSVGSGARVGGVTSAPKAATGFGGTRPSSVGSVVKGQGKGSLSGSGQTGAGATKLFESFRAKTTPPVQPNGRLNPADIDRVFKPQYRQERKAAFYADYQPPQTVIHQVQQQSSFGIWDSMMLWSMLDRGDRDMYYNHQDDDGMKSWRASAEEAAKTDPEIKRKLADLDKEMEAKKAKGQTVNPKYVTPGIDPDIYEANNIDQKNLKEIKICSGSIGADYNRYVAQIAKVTKLKVTTVQGNGSVDNVAKMATGECDLAFAQSDVQTTPDLLQIVRLSQLEGVLLFCGSDGKNGVIDVANLSSDITVYIGQDQTGSQFTFDRLKTVIAKFGTVKTDTSLPVSAAASKVVGNVKSCLFSVVTPRASFIKTLDQKDKARLVPIEAPDLSKTLYPLAWVDSDYFEHLTQKRFLGLGDSGTNTLAVATVLLAPRSWMEQNKTLFDLLMLESSNLQMTLQ